MRETYGHVLISIFFRHLVDVDEYGFTYKGKKYDWSSLGYIKIWQEELSAYGFSRSFPRASVELNDGRAISIRGATLVKKIGKLKPGFDSAFNELVALLQEKHRKNLSMAPKKCGNKYLP